MRCTGMLSTPTLALEGQTDYLNMEQLSKNEASKHRVLEEGVDIASRQ